MRSIASCSLVRPPRTCSALSPPSRLADRVHNPGLPAIEADIIVGGCCVLLAIMRRLDLKDCVVCETDLLDGIADELIALAS